LGELSVTFKRTNSFQTAKCLQSIQLKHVEFNMNTVINNKTINVPITLDVMETHQQLVKTIVSNCPTF